MKIMQTLAILRPFERRVLYLLLLSAVVLLVTLAGQAFGGQSAAPSPAAGRTAPAAELTTEALVARLRAELSADPDNAGLNASLGLALLQQVRETGDPALYGQAEAALNEAARLDPQQLDALIGQGQLALARHDFLAALDWGRQARAIMPYRAEALGIIVDAQIELGRYAEAVESAQAMVNLRPDLASYSRVSYIRELHGDTPGAIAAMAAAAQAGPPGAESTAWTTVQLGHLYFHSGDLASAEAAYAQALAQRPDYPYAQAGLARVQAARGEFQPAIAALEDVVARLPLPEFLLTLGQLYETTGDAARAEAQYDLLRAIQQLNAGSGMNVDLELALFEADHGDPAVALAMARRAYEQRPSIYAADALAWAAWRAGDYATAGEKITEALRLNTQDALLFYHAGLIAAARGETQDALTYLDKALSLNPAFDFSAAREATVTAAALREQLEKPGE
jgi:tetratricopeptide (TPR) repeat protein